MPGPLLNLLVPSVTDAEQHLPAFNSGSVSLSEAGKTGDSAQESAFTGVFQRAVSDTDADSPAETGVGSELPPGGNLLPDPQAFAAPDELLVPEGGVGMSAGESSLTAGDTALLPTFQTPTATTAPGFPSQAGTGSQDPLVPETAPSSPGLPTSKQLEQNVRAAESAGIATTLNEKSVFVEAGQASTANPVSADKLASVATPGAPEEYRRTAVSEQLHQRIADKLNAANGQVENTPLSPSTAIAAGDGDRVDAEFPEASAPDHLRSAAASTSDRVSTGKGSPAATEALRQKFMDADPAPGTRAAADNPVTAAATAASGTDRQTAAVVVSGLSSTPLGNLLQRGTPESLRNVRAGKTTPVIEEGRAVSVAIGRMHYQTTMETVQTMSQLPNAGTALPATAGAEQMADLPANSQDANRSVQAALNPVSVSATVTSNAGPAALSGATQLSVDIPVGHAAWEQSMARHVLQAGQSQLQTLQIKLNPANLGSLEVHIAVESETTSIVFSSHHAVVREAVEGAIPRLREMFSASGLNLGDVNVANQGAAQEQGRQSSGQFAGEQANGTGTTLADQPEAQQTTAIDNHGNSPEQLLDYYI